MSASGRPAIGVLALARATFDVALAEATAAAAFAALDAEDVELVGPRGLLFDADATRAALGDLAARPLDLVLVLQVTFADAGMAVATAAALDAPIALWAFPEPRTGGRLRLNSLCGVNLAAHALGLAGRPCATVFAPPGADGAGRAARLARHFVATPGVPDAAGTAPPIDAEAGRRVVARLRTARIGVFGDHPDGFPTCACDADRLVALIGVCAEARPLESVFAAARAVAPERVATARAAILPALGGGDGLDADALDKSLRVHVALGDLAEAAGFDALSVRCWPEFFTEYGCAACGALSFIGEAGRPCACEADVYGNVTSLMLQAAAGTPPFLADLVDVDTEDDTAVVWHCGLAPVSLADREQPIGATLHSNRRKPLLAEFALKPGRITIARLSQSLGRVRLVLAGAEMLRRPPSFSGTSGVLRFDRPAGEVLGRLLGEGLEHHYSLVYGDHRPALRGAARALGIETLELA